MSTQLHNVRCFGCLVFCPLTYTNIHRPTHPYWPTHLQIGEAKRIPSMRDKMQAEIAIVANKQYRQLARLFHSDKG